MRQYVNQFSIVFCSLFALSCTKEMSVNVPVFFNGRLTTAQPVSSQHLQLLNGVYSVIEGTEQLGKQVVIKRTGTTLSIFTGKNAGLFVFTCGVIDSALIFEGYWRYTQGSETGLAQFEIPAEPMGKSLLSGNLPGGMLKMYGTLGEGSAVPTLHITLQYERPITDTIFTILAHRGGGRNSDRLPASENSLGIIAIAESFGANGIEIDVRLTNDGIPILFHDENFSPRLVNTEYCVGPVSNYTFAAIRTLCTLKNGERIPTSREALDVVLNATSLSTIWLDIKSPNAIVPSAALAAEYKLKAAAVGRTVNIYLGLSTDDLVDEYKKENLMTTSEALCELSPDIVRSVNAKIWAPRWTLGPMNAESQQMRAEGRKTFVWTLDQREFILPFIAERTVDGILTNYPSLVAFEYYVLQ